MRSAGPGAPSRRPRATRGRARATTTRYGAERPDRHRGAPRAPRRGRGGRTAPRPRRAPRRRRAHAATRPGRWSLSS
ncbi:MAG: hypothetical protein E6G60_13510 [Actinobacteria bacterium]|nr:MAG: hypothetical protein E6G60_13510 [Actinomycetota bacterium]